METTHIEKRCGDSLNNVGSKYWEGNDKMHPFHTIIIHVVKLKLDNLEARLR